MMTNTSYVQSVLKENAEISSSMRHEIRQYAETFSWTSVIKNVYLPAVEKIMSK